MLLFIRSAVPAWFRVISDTPREIVGAVNIEIEGGVGSIHATLRIREERNAIVVGENFPGETYPAICHERHIQSDHNFCIGLNAGAGIVTRDHAVVWWGLLERFLRLQRVAKRTRRWPPQQEIAHGKAGPHQLKAFNAARQLGLEQDYLRMLEGEAIWFASKWPKLSTDGRMRNGRAPCPNGCLRKDGKAILRSDCCRGEAIGTLLREERLRRKEIAKFWDSINASNEECCGTMQSCPLSKKKTKLCITSDASNE
ncbi:E2 domain-containing protein [Brucella pituitosa]